MTVAVVVVWVLWCVVRLGGGLQRRSQFGPDCCTLKRSLTVQNAGSWSTHLVRLYSRVCVGFFVERIVCMLFIRPEA
jgi:hypothetical protein